MSYSLELSWKSTEHQADHHPNRPQPRWSQIRRSFSRGQRRRGGESVRPMVRGLLRKKEIRRLGMGRRSPHGTPVHESGQKQAEPGGHVQSVLASPRGPPGG